MSVWRRKSHEIIDESYLKLLLWCGCSVSSGYISTILLHGKQTNRFIVKWLSATEISYALWMDEINSVLQVTRAIKKNSKEKLDGFEIWKFYL